MLELEKLSAQELATVSRQAGEECGRRFRQIAGASDASDTALQELLGEMEKEAHLQLQALPEVEGRLPFGASRRIAPDGVREFIRASLPSLTKGFGEGTLHRDIALFYAESLEEEASRFYRMLAEHAHEAKTRCLFTDLSDRERGKLRFLREVVLQG
jgi:hypothetical protein